MDARRIIAGLGRTMIALGVLILLFVGYQLWGTGLTEARSQDRLRSDLLDALAQPEPERPEGPTATTAPPRAVPGDAIALMRIPKIGLEKAVIEGVSVEALKQAPGHYPTTPMPGQPGNAAIAGHRTTYGAPFYRLDELAPGDHIEVTTRQGEFTYEVLESVVVKPTQRDVLDPTGDNRLTLTTCHPRFSARERLVVSATLVDTPAPAPPPSETPPPPDLLASETLSGREASKLPVAGWGGLAALVWFLTWLVSKRWGRVPAYAMGVPVFLVVLFVFFENFARLLPANV